ncbi:IS200/IS605 family transposase [Catalinimonas sp. 4WD22]|uniref:IS200/IS605 family transposase n=1 Tax=Catalinimonas locisalis TaxID=3133978 RepID=UPI00310153CD
MSTYTQILYHIVFCPKNRNPCMLKASRPLLFKYIWGILKKKNCHLYRINGIEDHLHILTHLHPSVPLASLIKDIKLASNAYIKENNLFPDFVSWQEGYAAFTCSLKDKERLIHYIKKQEEHHKMKSLKEE